VLDGTLAAAKANSPFDVDRSPTKVPWLASENDDADDHDDAPALSRIEQKSP
jgi:hypothetical protein